MQNTRPRLQIIRGLPGSGKTTLALKRYPHLLRLETDMFFYSEGAYRFSKFRNERAVLWFLDEIEMLCMNKVDLVATGVFAAHTERLVETVARAVKWHYDIYIKTLTTQYKGVHAVPEEHFRAMKEAFIPNKELRVIYKDVPNVHFGLMPTKYPLEHLKRRNRKTT